MQPPKPTDTHVVVRATELSTSPAGQLLWSSLIKDAPLIDYVPAQAFRLADSKEVTIAWESDPYAAFEEELDTINKGTCTHCKTAIYWDKGVWYHVSDDGKRCTVPLNAEPE